MMRLHQQVGAVFQIFITTLIVFMQFDLNEIAEKKKKVVHNETKAN